MPEIVHDWKTETLTPLPAAKGKGGVYSPPKNEIENGVLNASTVQTILVAPQALYELWRDVEAAPLWQEYVVSVEKKTDTLSHWVFGDPHVASGTRVEYDSEIVADEPGKRLAWKSVDPKFEEAGEVTFEPTANGRGTLVTLRETMKVPGGSVGNIFAAMTKRSPKQIIIEDLRHFKELAESGEIPSVEGQPNGPRGFSGNIKSRLYGENNPTPPGTQGQA